MIRIVLLLIFIVNIINIDAATPVALSKAKPNTISKGNQQQQQGRQKANAVAKDPFFPKRPADQDEYEAILSGRKKLVTSFQITPVVATNTECIKSDKNTNCQWRELGIHERSSGFVMARNNNNANDPSHKFAISCIICGTDALCSDPDATAMKSTIDMNDKDGTTQHHLRMDKIVTEISNKCKTSKALERKLSMKQIHAIHEGLSGLMGLPESVGAGMVGANIGASDLLEDDRFGPGSDDITATVQGTKSLSPVRLNNMEFGKDMNNGDVKNANKYISPAALKKEADEALGEDDQNDATGPVGKEEEEEDEDDEADGTGSASGATGPDSDDDDNDDDDDASGSDDDDASGSNDDDDNDDEDDDDDKDGASGPNDEGDDDKDDASGGATGPEKKATTKTTTRSIQAKEKKVQLKSNKATPKVSTNIIQSKGKQPSLRSKNVRKKGGRKGGKKSKKSWKKGGRRGKKSVKRNAKRSRRGRKRGRRSRKGGRKRRRRGRKGGRKKGRRRGRSSRKGGIRSRKGGIRSRIKRIKQSLLAKRAKSFLELGNIKKADASKAMDFEAFKTNAAFVDGICGKEGDNGNVALLFQNVFIGKGGKVKFSCVDNKLLCDCISKIGQSKQGVTITDSKFTFKLTGNGQVCKYEIIDHSKGSGNNGSSRRRLLQRGEGGVS